MFQEAYLGFCGGGRIQLWQSSCFDAIAEKLILNQLEKQYIEKREELRKIQAKYSWASDKENPVQQSIADALMYIGFMKLV